MSASEDLCCVMRRTNSFSRDPISTGITGLSPLDQIRLVEAETARQLVAAREAAEKNVLKVRALAEQTIHDARDTGRKEGEADYKNIILSAEEEAQAILAQAQHRAAELKRRGSQRMAPLTMIAIDLVMGLNGEARAHEH
jgi:vacuolar-type H+-ATPase subunit H